MQLRGRPAVSSSRQSVFVVIRLRLQNSVSKEEKRSAIRYLVTDGVSWISRSALLSNGSVWRTCITIDLCAGLAQVQSRRNLLKFWYTVLECQPYSPNLLPFYFPIFDSLKKTLKVRYFYLGSGIMDNVRKSASKQPKDIYSKCIHILVKQ